MEFENLKYLLKILMRINELFMLIFHSKRVYIDKIIITVLSKIKFD